VWERGRASVGVGGPVDLDETATAGEDDHDAVRGLTERIEPGRYRPLEARRVDLVDAPGGVRWRRTEQQDGGTEGFHVGNLASPGPVVESPEAPGLRHATLLQPDAIRCAHPFQQDCGCLERWTVGRWDHPVPEPSGSYCTSTIPTFSTSYRRYSGDMCVLTIFHVSACLTQTRL